MHPGVRYVVEFVLAVFASALVAYGPRLIARVTAIFGTIIGIFIIGLVAGAAVITVLWGALLYLLYATGRDPGRVRPSDLAEVLGEALGVTTDDLAVVEDQYEDAVDRFEQDLAEIRTAIATIEADTDIDVSRLRTSVDRVATRLEALDRTVADLYDIDPASTDEYRDWDSRFEVALDDLETAVSELLPDGRALLGDPGASGTADDLPVTDDVRAEWTNARRSLDRTWDRRLKPKTQVLVNEVVNQRNLSTPQVYRQLSELGYMTGGTGGRSVISEPPAYAKTAVVLALALVGAIVGTVTLQAPLPTVALGLVVLVVGWFVRSRMDASVTRTP